MIDTSKSIEKSIQENEIRLGRKLTREEESAITDEVNSWSNAEVQSGLGLFIVVAVVAGFILEKIGSVVSGAYSSYVEPYWLWMLQPHTDSFLNLILQVYLWPILVPLAICVVIVFLPSLITLLLIGFGFSWLSNRAGGAHPGGLLASLGTLLCLIMALVCPICVFFYSFKAMSKFAFILFASFHDFIKNKIFRLKRLSLFWWLFLTHLAIPAILISCVVLFAADKSHIKNGKNVYRDASEWRAN